MKLHALLKNPKNQSGFTLVELLMASVLTLIVVGVAGYGTLVVLRENMGSNVASDTQYNTNRAADFISDELKSATSILTDFTTANGCKTGSYTPVLAFTVPGQTNPIVYCLGATNSSDPWLGKNVIYRWGPSLNSSGAYGSWPTSPQPLMDLIADTPQNPNCPSGWSKIPSSGAKGFFVCVEPTNLKMVELHISTSALDINDSKAKTTSWMKSSTDTNNTGRFADKATYEVVTQVYARAPSDLAISVSPTSISAGSTTPLVFTVRRAGDTSQAITVNLTATPSNSAKFSPNPITSTLSLSIGESSKTLTITPTGSPNALASGDSLAISIASGTGYAISTGSATVTVGP